MYAHDGQAGCAEALSCHASDSGFSLANAYDLVVSCNNDC